jgi:hypothetical protein
MQRSFFPHCFKHVITRFVPLAVDQQDPGGTGQKPLYARNQTREKLVLQGLLRPDESNDGGNLEIDRRLGAAIFDE